MKCQNRYPKRKTMRNCLGLVLLLLPLLAWAQTKPQLETHFFFDPSGQINLKEVFSIPESEWTESPTNHVRFNFLQREYYQANAGAALWLRVRIAANTSKEDLWLELMPNVGHDGQIAMQNNGKWQWYSPVGRSGSEMSQVPTRYLTFKLPEENQSEYAYIKLSTRQIFNILLQAKPLDQMIAEKVWHTLFFGFIAGTLLLALVYNAVIGFIVKENVYVYYAIYVMSIIVYIATMAGYVRVIFPSWTSSPNLANVSALAVISAVILFVRELLDTKLILAKFDRLLGYTQVALIIGMIVILLGPIPVAYYVSEIFGLTFPILVFVVAVLAVKKRHPLAKYFLCAWMLIISIAACWSWMFLGLFEPSQELVNLMLVGVAVEILLLALVLGLRFSTLKEQTKRLTDEKKKLILLSEIDELTGLLNRRGFLNKVERLVSTQKRFFWLVLDIDNFKQFNDTHGHLIGDQLLAKTGKLLQKFEHDETEQKDQNQSKHEVVTARIGGEEFAVLLIDCSQGCATNFAEDLREAFAGIEIQSESGERLSTTISCGGTEKKENESYKRTWKRADDHLYQAKDDGRDRVVIA